MLQLPLLECGLVLNICAVSVGQALSHGLAWSPPSGCHGLSSILVEVLSGTKGCPLLEPGPPDGPLHTFLWIIERPPSLGTPSLGEEAAGLWDGSGPLCPVAAKTKQPFWWPCRHLPHTYPPPRLKDETLKKFKSGLNCTSQHLERLAGLRA